MQILIFQPCLFILKVDWASLEGIFEHFSLLLQLTSNFLFRSPEEVILNEERTTEEERRYIMEARKRAMQKRKKLRTLGKSRSTESEDEEEEEEGKTDTRTCNYPEFKYEFLVISG